jgi:hypothetical protein
MDVLFLDLSDPALKKIEYSMLLICMVKCESLGTKLISTVRHNMLKEKRKEEIRIE